MNVHTMGFYSQTHNSVGEEVVRPRILRSLIARLCGFVVAWLCGFVVALLLTRFASLE